MKLNLPSGSKTLHYGKPDVVYPSPLDLLVGLHLEYRYLPGRYGVALDAASSKSSAVDFLQ